MSASTQCPHSDLHIDVNNAGFGNTNLHYLEIKAHCTICGKPAVFRGPVGMQPDHPAMSLAGDEVRLPFVIEGETYDGKAHGYSVRQIR